MIRLYETRQVSPSFYLIFENYAPGSQLTMGLVIGQEKAALIDSGMGVFGEELKEVVTQLTDRPVVNILTHGHPDHIGGSVLFDEVYMNERDESHIPRLTKEKRLQDTRMFSHGDEEVISYAKAHCLDCAGFHYRNADEGDVFDLGGVKLEIFKLPGHSLGSIAVFNRGENFAMVGDAFSERVAAAALPNLASFERMAEAIAHFLSEVPEDAALYGGHWREPVKREVVLDELACARELSQGKVDSDEEIYLPMAPIPRQRKHVYGRVEISYNPAILPMDGEEH